MRISELRIGMFVNFKNELCSVFEKDHVTPGKGRAKYQMAFKHLASGRILRESFRPEDELENVHLDGIKAQFLYSDADGFHFMDNESYESMVVAENVVGDMSHYMKEGSTVKLFLYQGNPVSIELPSSVDLKVVEAPVGLKGDTASSTTKPIVLETGYQLNAPLFISDSDTVKVDTRTGKYLGKA